MRRLSIILPVLDEASAIGARLAALQALRAQGVELVVADGGSRDGTAARCAGLADHVLIAACGRARQMNAGAAISHGEILLFLHADTELPPRAFDAIVGAIDAGALWGRFDVRIDGSHPLLRIVERMMNWRSRLTGIATGDQAIFLRRDLFERIGGYQDIPLMEDIRLCARLKREAAPACLAEPVTTSARRWEQHGVWRTMLLMWRLRAAHYFGANPEVLARRYGYRSNS
ncbi:MAG: TIGR04283 family arsenosugar biosynthesis glycosyltransferase [Rhodocyclales bacterium]|nr:TIGR04283 family arsenosugar biosynthesis glycosyltransferase [Rhodocyclales bacterium]